MNKTGVERAALIISLASLSLSLLKEKDTLWDFVLQINWLLGWGAIAVVVVGFPLAVIAVGILATVKVIENDGSIPTGTFTSPPATTIVTVCLLGALAGGLLCGFLITEIVDRLAALPQYSVGVKLLRFMIRSEGWILLLALVGLLGKKMYEFISGRKI
jgi:hypothetical protein